jgi:hypothetical protein
MKQNPKSVPQLRVRTDLIAGESVDACQKNLEYWRKQLQSKCNKSARPYEETEMQWWQAGSV